MKSHFASSLTHICNLNLHLNPPSNVHHVHLLPHSPNSKQNILNALILFLTFRNISQKLMYFQHLYFAGGCRESDRPSTIKICQPGCNVPHSYCRDVDTCDCVTGYHPIFAKDNLLAECSRKVAGKNGTGKGDMTAENMALYFPGTTGRVKREMLNRYINHH